LETFLENHLSNFGIPLYIATMEDESHISDIANEIFGIQSQMSFHFFISQEDSHQLTEDKRERLKSVYDNFPNWLSQKGYYISSKEEETECSFNIVFNQLVTLEEFVDRLEDESKEFAKANAADGTPSCRVGGDQDKTYLIVYEKGDWRFARQRPRPHYNYRGGYGTTSTSGYAGSSSFSGGSFTGRGPAGLTGKAGTTGTTGTWAPMSPSIRNKTKGSKISEVVKRITKIWNGNVSI